MLHITYLQIKHKNKLLNKTGDKTIPDSHLTHIYLNS